MYDRENDNRNNEGRQVQQELEDQLRAFGDTMTDAFAHGFEGRGMDIGDRAFDVGKAAVHAANYGISEAGKAMRQARDSYYQSQRQAHANSGTAEGTMPAPATPAWEALVGLLGTGGGITTAEKQALLAVLRLLAAGNDAAMNACDRLATLWDNPQPPKENVFAVLGQAILGKMILGRNK